MMLTKALSLFFLLGSSKFINAQELSGRDEINTGGQGGLRLGTPSTTHRQTESTSRCRIFVSSKTYEGDLGGLDGADDKCNKLARNAGLISSSRNNAFKAIIFSDQENDPDYNPATVFSDCSGGYFLVNKLGKANTAKKVADNRDDLFDPTTDLKNAIDYFEDGEKRTGTRNVWTGAEKKKHEFVAAYEDCYKDWDSVHSKTGRRGRSTATDSKWLDVGTSDCDNGRRIYCAEQK